MLSSLEAGATFRISDLASPALEAIAAQMKELGLQADRVKEVMTSISRTTFAGLDGRLDTLAASVKAIGDAGVAAADRMAAGFDAAAITMSATIKKLEEQIAGMKVEGAPIALPGGPSALLGGPRGSGTPLPGWGGRGGGGHGGGLT
jgi:hypothetical protein